MNRIKERETSCLAQAEPLGRLFPGSSSVRQPNAHLPPPFHHDGDEGDEGDEGHEGHEGTGDAEKGHPG